MGATLTIDDPELALVLFDERCKAELDRIEPGNRQICWYDLHGESNPGDLHSGTTILAQYYNHEITDKNKY